MLVNFYLRHSVVSTVGYVKSLCQCTVKGYIIYINGGDNVFVRCVSVCVSLCVCVNRSGVGPL